jgi:hypothetical protein
MAAFGAVDIPTRGVDDFRATLRDREAKLAAAKKQRDTVLADIRRASERVDAGDKAARFELLGLNKANVAAGRLVLSLEADVEVSKKRVERAENQVAAVETKRAIAEAATVPHDRLFEVETPDARRVRHHHATADSLQKMLQPGYKVVAEVFNAGIDGNGGLVEPLGHSTMKTLLTVHGDELIAFLEAQGFMKSSSGREVMQ